MIKVIRKRTVVIMGAFLLFSGALASHGETARIDSYRNILQGGSYTIHYDNITPSERVTNRDKVDIFGRAGMSVEKNDYLTNRPKSGVVVSDGENRYEEVGDGEFNSCHLSRQGEDFYFTKYKKDGVYEYFGVKKNKVEATSRNYLAETVAGKSYGDPDMTRLINSMLSAGRKGGCTYVKGGSLSNGLSYEDYKGSYDGRTHIIRYYFQGNDLVKIASADFYRTNSGIDGHKCIIKIKEFTGTADLSLLRLPSGVEDVTKRKK